MQLIDLVRAQGPEGKSWLHEWSEMNECDNSLPNSSPPSVRSVRMWQLPPNSSPPRWVKSLLVYIPFWPCRFMPASTSYCEVLNCSLSMWNISHVYAVSCYEWVVLAGLEATFIVWSSVYHRTFSTNCCECVMKQWIPFVTFIHPTHAIMICLRAIAKSINKTILQP